MSSTEEWTEYKAGSTQAAEGLDHFGCGDTKRRRQRGTTTTVLGCWAKFAEFDASDVLHAGYFHHSSGPKQSPDPYLIGKNCIKEPTPGGLALRWVCGECFEESEKSWHFAVESL